MQSLSKRGFETGSTCVAPYRSGNTHALVTSVLHDSCEREDVEQLLEDTKFYEGQKAIIDD